MRPEVVPFSKSLPQLRSAANAVMSRHHLGGEAPAVEALTEALNAEDRPDLRSRLSALISIASNIEANDIVPPKFGDAVKHGCRRENIQLHDLTKLPGVGWKLHDWVRGRSSPDRLASFGAVKALEVKLGFKPRELWNRVRFHSCALGTIPREYWPAEIPHDAAIKKEIKFYLPDEILTLPAEARRELILTAYGIVMIKRDKHVDEQHIANCADPYRHNAAAWGETLCEDMEGLLAYHRFKPDIDDEADDSLWVKGTRERSQTYVEKTMGAVLRLWPTFETGDLTLGLFAIPQVVKDTIEFARTRRNKISVDLHPEPIAPYSAEDIQLCVFAKTMLAEGGYLQQRPEFFGKLNAQARELLAEKFHQTSGGWAEICSAGDWTAICAAAEAWYAARIAKIDKWIKDAGPKLSRPKVRIVEVLDNDLHDFRVAFGNILAMKLAKCEPGYRAWAYATQNLVYHEMVAQFPHRSRAIVETKWATAEQSSSVRCVGGTWYWRVHWTSVKNGRKNGLFRDKEFFDGKLKDTNGLYAALHEYTRPKGARDWILKGRSSDSFFVTSSKNPEMNANKLYARVAASTLFVLSQIEDERWATTRCFGTHAERKIGFNSVLEPVSSPTYALSFLKACGMLLITPKVANDHYLYAPPEERASGVPEALDKQRRERQAPHSLH